MINKNLKKISSTNKKPMYLYISNILGIDKYKSKFIFNLGSNYFYKKRTNLSKINLECIYSANKHSIININLYKKNSIKFNNIRLSVIKNNNENKNFYKKNL